MLEHVRREAHVRRPVGKRKPKPISDDATLRYGAARGHRDPMRPSRPLLWSRPSLPRLKSSYLGLHEDTPSAGCSECICEVSDATTDIEHDVPLPGEHDG